MIAVDMAEMHDTPIERVDLSKYPRDPACAPVIKPGGPLFKHEGCGTRSAVRARLGRRGACGQWLSRRSLGVDPLHEFCPGCIEAAVVAIEREKGVGWLPRPGRVSRNDEIAEYLMGGSLDDNDPVPRKTEPSSTQRKRARVSRPYKRRPPMTEAMAAEAVSLYVGGLSYAGVAAALGCGEYRARKVIGAAGVARGRGKARNGRVRWPTMTPAQAAHVVSLYLSGMTVAECADAVPVGDYQVQKAIREARVARTQEQTNALRDARRSKGARP